MMLFRQDGKMLELAFSPDGSLSKAQFEGQDVTGQLRYVRESDCEELLRGVGFGGCIHLDEASALRRANVWAESVGLAVFRVQSSSTGRVGVELITDSWQAYCTNSPVSVHPVCCAKAWFRSYEESPYRVTWEDA